MPETGQVCDGQHRESREGGTGSMLGSFIHRGHCLLTSLTVTPSNLFVYWLPGAVTLGVPH